MGEVPEWLQNANEYAVALVRSNKLHAGEVTLKRALRLAPQSYELWTNLGACLWNQRKYVEASEAIGKALEIEPYYPKALANLGLIYEGLGKYKLSELAFSGSIEEDPLYLDAIWDRSLLYLGIGEYEKGWKDYDVRIDRQRHLTYPHLSDMPMWQGESLAGKTIHVETEQGIGDTILFSRFLPWLSQEAEKVYFCTGPKMTSLLWEFETRGVVKFIPQKVPLPRADYYCYLASIPRWYRCRTDNIPCDPGLIKSRLSPQPPFELPQPSITPSLKVGICWTGNPIQDRNEERSVPFHLMMSLAEHPCVALYSLQVGHGSDEIVKAGAEGLVYDLSSKLEEREFVGTCEAIKQCDLVVTCCTSVVHMAGATGVPTWLLLCKDPYWPWMYSESTDNLWYPSVKLFRQKEVGDWKSVIGQVRSELSALIQSRFGDG